MARIKPAMQGQHCASQFAIRTLPSLSVHLAKKKGEGNGANDIFAHRIELLPANQAGAQKATAAPQPTTSQAADFHWEGIPSCQKRGGGAGALQGQKVASKKKKKGKNKKSTKVHPPNPKPQTPPGRHVPHPHGHLLQLSPRQALQKWQGVPC